MSRRTSCSERIYDVHLNHKSDGMTFLT